MNKYLILEDGTTYPGTWGRKWPESWCLTPP